MDHGKRWGSWTGWIGHGYGKRWGTWTGWFGNWLGGSWHFFMTACITSCHHATPFADFDDTCITSCHAISVTTACMQHVMLHNIPYMSWDSIFTWIACRASSSLQIHHALYLFDFSFFSQGLLQIFVDLCWFFWAWRVSLLKWLICCKSAWHVALICFHVCTSPHASKLSWFD